MNYCSNEDVLVRPRACTHAAHLYTDSGSLCGALARYVGAGVERGEAAVVIAVEGHTREMVERLGEGGRDVGALLASGQLVCLDADAVLGRIMDGREPDARAFDEAVRRVVDGALGKFPGLCAYGELVNILWHQDNREAAHRLEEMWNGLIAERGFSLLCGYRADVFADDAGVDQICRTHSHLIPGTDGEGLERALRTAFRDVFRNGDAAALCESLAEQCRHPARMPAGQAALAVLREILPSAAEEVRMRAHAYYRGVRCW